MVSLSGTFILALCRFHDYNRRSEWEVVLPGPCFGRRPGGDCSVSMRIMIKGIHVINFRVIF